MLQYVSKGEHDDKWYFSAYDQCWDDSTLKELWEENNIIFMPDGIDAVHAVMIVEREGERPVIVVGFEDDGTLYFEREYGQFVHGFDARWIDSLVKTLLEAEAKINGEAKAISEKEHQQYEALRNEVKDIWRKRND